MRFFRGLYFLLATGIICSFLCLNGCSKPEYVADSELGTTTDALPELKDRPVSYKLPEGVEDKDCIVERRLLSNLEK